MHLEQELSEKHRPTPIENLSLHLDESQKKQVFSSIISRLKNEVLSIEEFKKIAFQQISESLNAIRDEVDKFTENFLKNLEGLCARASEELRAGLALSKLSLNMNHPVLDLFKHCRTAEDVKNVQVVVKDLSFEPVNVLKLLQNHVKLEFLIKKDNSRSFPVKSPAETNGFLNKSVVMRHASDISLASVNSANDSFSSLFTSSAASPEIIESQYSRLFNRQVFPEPEKFSLEMELQERVLLKIDKSQLSEYKPATLYKISAFSDEISGICLDTLQKNVAFTHQERLFPKSAWCISEDDKLFITGGFDGTARKSVVVFNLKSNKNEKVMFMNQPRFNHSAVSCGKNVYVFAGFCGKPLKNCEKFCLVKKNWKKIGNLAVAREKCAVCVHFNLIYIFGGNGVESVEMYSPYKKKFILLSMRLSSPGKCVAFGYDDKIFILQKDRVFLAETPKNCIKEIDKIKNGEWWTPCEPFVTTDFAYFFYGEELVKVCVLDFQLEILEC
jgi:hypothetical protein